MSTFEKTILTLNTLIALISAGAAVGSCQAAVSAKEAAKDSREIIMRWDEGKWDQGTWPP